MALGATGGIVNGVGRGSEDNRDKNNKAKIATRETVGMTFLLFGGLLFFIVATGPLLFGDVGKAITAFFLGTAGFYAYFLLVALVVGSISLVSGKRLLPKGWTLRTVLFVTAVFFIVHAATAERFFLDPVSSEINSFGGYLSGCFYAAGETALDSTGGGVLLGLLGYPIRFLFQSVGAYIVYALVLVFALWFLLLGTPLRAYLLPGAKKAEEQTEKLPVKFEDIPAPERSRAPVAPPSPVPAAAYADPAAQMPVPAPAPTPAQYANFPERTAFGSPRNDAQTRSREILFGKDPATNYRENLIYNEDSLFNSQPRRSNIRPTDSYADRYADGSGSTRSPMPRRVTDSRQQETDSGYSYPLNEDNYPQKPSYRAPIADAPKQDFYKNDVPEEPAPAPAPAPAPMPPFGQQPAYDQRSAFEQRPAFDQRSAFEQRPAFDQRSVFEQRPASDQRSAFEQRPTFNEPREQGAFGQSLFGDAPARSDRSFPPPAAPSEPETATDEFLSRGRRDITPPEPETTSDELFSRGRRDITPPEPETTSDELFSRGRRDITPPEPETPSDEFLSRGRRDITPPEPETTSDELFSRGRRDITPPEPETTSDELSESRIFDSGLRSNASLFDDDGPLDEEEPPAPPPAPERKAVPKKKKHVWPKYKRPSTDLLNSYEDRPTLSNEEVGRNSGIILDTLRRYKIETHVIGVKPGASVTRYDLAMPENATISNVTRYDEELAVYLQVKGVNMYANPEVRGISVEVPNEKRSTVGLKSVLESDEFKKDSPDALLFALGQDVEGRSLCGNITDMTHILVAGMTGSGKSITMHAMLISMLFKYSPEELRLILIDPKQSEFTLYEGIPHLMINEIITQPPKAVAALNWAVAEMERRYTLFNEKTRAGTAVSKIDEYNQNLGPDEERLPKIIIVVDEFSDLMMTSKKEVEDKIIRLAQKARAAGIHLVLATQRPDATVITGVIKSNLPTRISLSVDSDLNSRIMLDESGAEKLLGLGDMIIKAGGKSRRAQGAFISASERQRVINYIRENNECWFDDSVAEAIERPDSASGGGMGGDGGEVNETYIRALGVVVKRGQASISLIQRSLGIGYNHAGKIIEWMESQGFISAFEGSKARTVLLTKEEFESRFGGLD